MTEQSALLEQTLAIFQKYRAITATEETAALLTQAFIIAREQSLNRAIQDRKIDKAAEMFSDTIGQLFPGPLPRVHDMTPPAWSKLNDDDLSDAIGQGLTMCYGSDWIGDTTSRDLIHATIFAAVKSKILAAS